MYLGMQLGIELFKKEEREVYISCFKFIYIGDKFEFEF